MHTLERVKIIGLTGQSGSGKSTVSDIFSDNGFIRIDADAVSRHVAGNPAFLDEAKLLYPDCVNDDGLDRKKLASIVFADEEKLIEYTSIIFPYIVQNIFDLIRDAADRGADYILLDAPTLFESGLDDICNVIVSVTAPYDILVDRIIRRDGINEDMAKLRLSAMKSAEWYISRSDYCISNSGTLDKLRECVLSIITQIKDRFNV